MSLGAADLLDDGSPNLLVAAADTALYAAKTSGRNRVATDQLATSSARRMLPGSSAVAIRRRKRPVGGLADLHGSAEDNGPLVWCAVRLMRGGMWWVSRVRICGDTGGNAAPPRSGPFTEKFLSGTGLQDSR